MIFVLILIFRRILLADSAAVWLLADASGHWLIVFVDSRLVAGACVGSRAGAEAIARPAAIPTCALRLILIFLLPGRPAGCEALGTLGPTGASMRAVSGVAFSVFLFPWVDREPWLKAKDLDCRDFRLFVDDVF